MSEEQSLWPLRLLALVIAGALWLTTSFVPRIQELRVERVQQQIDASVSYRTPEGFMILNPEQTVTVTVRGREEDVYSLSDDDVHVAIPFPENVIPGAIEAPIRAEDVNLPPGLEVLDILPSTLSLILDRREKRTVPVVALYRGEPLVGYSVDEQASVVIPDEVEIEGPEQDVAAIGEINAVVNVGGRGIPEFEAQIPLSSNNENVRVVRPNLVTVKVRMLSRESASGGAPGF